MVGKGEVAVIEFCVVVVMLEQIEKKGKGMVRKEEEKEEKEKKEEGMRGSMSQKKTQCSDTMLKPRKKTIENGEN